MLDELAQPLLTRGFRGERANVDEMLCRLRAGVISANELSGSNRLAPLASVAPWDKLKYDSNT